jgi:hypothetical protein
LGKYKATYAFSEVFHAENQGPSIDKIIEKRGKNVTKSTYILMEKAHLKYS